METLDQSKLIQFSSDGPRVTLKFFSIINEQHDEGDHLLMIDIGNCSLHTIRESFKNWIISPGWKIDAVLRWMWNLLKESPAKREIYKKISSGNVCPLTYCKARWCENDQTAERAALRGYQTYNPIVLFLRDHCNGY